MQQRLGNKVLRQRLRGPALAAYYPRRSASVEDVLNEFKRFDLEGFNEAEDDRLENVQFAKLRGKGAPKKKRTAAGMVPDTCSINTRPGADLALRESGQQEEKVNAAGEAFEALYNTVEIPSIQTDVRNPRRDRIQTHRDSHHYCFFPGNFRVL
jgi:hypothetical protein